VISAGSSAKVVVMAFANNPQSAPPFCLLISRVHNIRRGRVSNVQYTLYKCTATSLLFDEIYASPNMARH